MTEMEDIKKAKAVLRNLKIAPKKLMIFCKIIRSKPVNQAMDILDFSKKNVARDVKKLLKSAVANAVNNHNMSVDNLFIYEIYSNEARRLKRSLPRAKGKADKMLRRYSHLTIKLCEKNYLKEV